MPRTAWLAPQRNWSSGGRSGPEPREPGFVQFRSFWTSPVTSPNSSGYLSKKISIEIVAGFVRWYVGLAHWRSSLTPGLFHSVVFESENSVGLYWNVRSPRNSPSTLASEALAIAIPGIPAPSRLTSESQEPGMGELERLRRPLVAADVQRRPGPLDRE